MMAKRRWVRGQRIKATAVPPLTGQLEFKSVLKQATDHGNLPFGQVKPVKRSILQRQRVEITSYLHAMTMLL